MPTREALELRNRDRVWPHLGLLLYSRHDFVARVIPKVDSGAYWIVAVERVGHLLLTSLSVGFCFLIVCYRSISLPTNTCYAQT